MEEGLEPAALQQAQGATGPSSKPVLLLDAREFVAGGVGGASGVLAGQPLDTVRIRQQQPGAAGAGAAHFIRHIASAEGPRALFRGMSYPLCTSALQNAVVFQGYGTAGRLLTGGEPAAGMTLAQVFWAGCFAGVVQTVVVVPVDVLKIRLQLQTAVRGSPGYVGPLTLLARILRTEGLRGLYRGTAITSIRDFPSHGVYFAAYEACREALEPGSRSGGSQSPLALWAAGGFAGALSWLSVYPFDVVKTRVQAAAVAQSPYSGWVDCMRQSYAAEGSGVFFRGLSTTLGRAFLVNGAIFSAYELCHKLLSKQQDAAADEWQGDPL